MYLGEAIRTGWCESLLKEASVEWSTTGYRDGFKVHVCISLFSGTIDSEMRSPQVFFLLAQKLYSSQGSSGFPLLYCLPPMNDPPSEIVEYLKIHGQ